MRYVLITPAHNEERFITKTLDSMVAQTVLPERWVIVDDGSTDRTAEIVRSNRRGGPEGVIDAVEARAPDALHESGGVVILQCSGNRYQAIGAFDAAAGEHEFARQKTVPLMPPA